MMRFEFDSGLRCEPGWSGRQTVVASVIVLLGFVTIFALLYGLPAWADSARLPGEDISSQMESAGTLLRFIDTGIFKWSARILAGLCIFGAGWNLKEMRFGPAFISMIAALLFGTAPTWVRNIFSVGGSDSVFSQADSPRLRTRSLEEEHLG